MFQKSKRPFQIFDFPLIIRHQLQSICINIPDLSVAISIAHPFSTSLSPQERKGYYATVGKAVIKAWAMGEEALRESKKSGTPRVPSSQRRTLAALKDELLSPKQVALISGVSYKTVQRAVDAKQLSCIKTKGGHRRIPVEVAEQWVRSLLNKANNRLNGL